MKPPARLKIGPHTYRVILDDDRLGEGDHVGRTDSDRLTITLDPTLPHTATADTLLHECVHCIFSSMDLERELEEELALHLAPALLALLRENPRLTTWLTGD